MNRHWGSEHADEVDLPWVHTYAPAVPRWIGAALIATGIVGLALLCLL